MTLGFKIGSQLSSHSPLIIIIFAFIIGNVVVLAEPAVHVLNNQVQEITGGEVTVTLSGGTPYNAVDDASNPVALTDNGGGSYTLTMPASDVTISAN